MKIQLFPPLSFQEMGHRSNQEDALWPAHGMASSNSRLFIVCDGMGGHEHGEVASQTVATTMGRFLEEKMEAGVTLSDDLLREALNEAYNQLDEKDQQGDVRKMGTTLTLVAFHQGGATMAHIGDSRIYHLRPSQRRVLYQSRDHSLVMDLYLAGELTREEVDSYERKNVITRAMQPHLERRPKADIVHTTDILPGDVFMLCSDGVLEQLTNDDLIRLFSDEKSSDGKKCRRLLELTADNADNHSAYLLHIAEVQQEPGDNDAPNDESRSRSNMMVLEQQLLKEQSTSQTSPTRNPSRKPSTASSTASSWLSRMWAKIVK